MGDFQARQSSFLVKMPLFTRNSYIFLLTRCRAKNQQQLKIH
jgi:hypothetical protein